jgi:hypothetical protein
MGRFTRRLRYFFLLLTEVQVLWSSNNEQREPIICFPIATTNNIILLTTTRTSTTLQRECIVAFPWQQLLWEHAKELPSTSCKFAILFNNLEVRKT